MLLVLTCIILLSCSVAVPDAGILLWEGLQDSSPPSHSDGCCTWWYSWCTRYPWEWARAPCLLVVVVVMVCTLVCVCPSTTVSSLVGSREVLASRNCNQPSCYGPYISCCFVLYTMYLFCAQQCRMLWELVAMFTVACRQGPYDYHMCLIVAA